VAEKPDAKRYDSPQELENVACSTSPKRSPCSSKGHTGEVAGYKKFVMQSPNECGAHKEHGGGQRRRAAAIEKLSAAPQPNAGVAAVVVDHLGPAR